MPRCWCCGRSREALSIEVAALISDRAGAAARPDAGHAPAQRLSPGELAEARELIAQRFGNGRTRRAHGRIALVGLRGAGKTTLGQLAAEALGVPFIELDREIERACGMELSEIFATQGQAMFRELERQCLLTVVHASSAQ